jgi:tetratricopeptide (TPR) repeat protein
LNIKENYINFTADAVKPKYFFGREKELKKLKTLINKRKQNRIISIHGIAGIGKTTLAAKLLEYYKVKKHLFWHNFTNWDTIRNVLSHMNEFFTQIDEGNLKLYIDLNQPLDLEKILSLLKERLKELNAIFIFDDFQKINTELRNFFISLLDIFEKTKKPKFIFLSRYNIPFYDQQKVIVKKTVAELQIGGLDFKSSSQLLKKKRLPPEKYPEIYDITTGHPLLLEIIESDKRAKRYIFEEIFSQFAIEERIVMEVLSTYRIPVPYDAFFIDERVSPNSINNLAQKLIIKEQPDGIYDSHEFIKDFFYNRMNPHARRKYHKFCAEFYLENKQLAGYLEALYHLIKSTNYQKAIEIAIKKSQTIRDLGLSEQFIIELEELSDDDIILPQLPDILMLKAKLYFITGTWDKALQCFHRVIEVATELEKDEVKAKAFCEIGYIREEQNSIDDALENFQRGLEISTRINNKKISAEAKRGIGRCHWRKSDYKNAEKYYNDCLKELKNIDDYRLIGAIHIDIGNIFFETNRNDKAVMHYETALNYLEKTDNKLEIARAYNNLGTVYTYIKKYETAIDYYKKQLDIAEITGDIRLLGYGLSNIGYCYAKLNRISDAEKYTKNAKKIFDKTKNENILFKIYKTNGLIYQYHGNWKKAIDNFQRSIKILNKLNVTFSLPDTLFELSSLYEKKGELAKAKAYAKQAQQAKEG